MKFTSTLLRVLGLLALIALLGYILWEGRTILLYFIVASVVALIGRPLFNLLDKVEVKGRKMPKAGSAMVTLLALMAMLTGIIGIFLPLVLSEAQVLYSINFSEIKSSLGPLIERTNLRMQDLGISKDSEVSEAALLEYLFNSINFRSIPAIVNGVLGVFGNMLIAIFSVAFMTFFLLRDQHLVPRLIIAITPKSKEPSAHSIITNTRRTLSRYFVGLVLQVSAITLCIWIGLSIVGIKNALLIAFFTGLANLIPYVGPWIGALFGTIVLVSNNVGMGFYEYILPMFYGMLAVYAITQLLDNYIFQPVIFSNSINAHPLEIFIVILIAGTIGGVIGMVAAIPTYAFIRIVVIELDREFGFIDSIKNQ